MQILRANIMNVPLTDAYVNEYAETDERHHHITGESRVENVDACNFLCITGEAWRERIYLDLVRSLQTLSDFIKPCLTAYLVRLCQAQPAFGTHDDIRCNFFFSETKGH